MSYLNASLTLIFGGFRAPFEKWWRDRLFYAKIFKRVLDITPIKMCHLKGEKKWESSGRLETNGLQREGGLSECRQLINEAYISVLRVLEAFSSFFWIKKSK